METSNTFPADIVNEEPIHIDKLHTYEIDRISVLDDYINIDEKYLLLLVLSAW